MKGVIYLSFILYSSSGAFAGDRSVDSTGKFRAGVGLSTGLSYTGLNGSLLLNAGVGRHSIYAGPKTVLSDGYLFTSVVNGYQAGYNYTVLGTKRWTSLANLDYQVAYYKPYNPNDLVVNKNNRVHEIVAALGLYYSVGKRRTMSVGLNAGMGSYKAVYKDVVTGRSSEKRGYTSGARVTVLYNFLR